MRVFSIILLAFFVLGFLNNTTSAFYKVDENGNIVKSDIKMIYSDEDQLHSTQNVENNIRKEFPTYYYSIGDSGEIKYSNENQKKIIPRKMPWAKESTEKKENKIKITQRVMEKGATSYYQFHEGIDYGLKYKKMYAPFNGKIVHAGYQYGYGNIIGIKNDEKKYYVIIGHLSRLNVKVGDYVTKNTEIGTTGNTGEFTTGAHLHIEFYKNGLLQSEKSTTPLVESFVYKTDIKNLSYDNYTMKQVFSGTNLYKETYGVFFDTLTTTALRYNIPEAQLLYYKLTTERKFDEIGKLLSESPVYGLKSGTIKHKKKRLHVKNYINCHIGEKLRKKSYNCDKYSYGTNVMSNILAGLYDKPTISEQIVNVVIPQVGATKITLKHNKEDIIRRAIVLIGKSEGYSETCEFDNKQNSRGYGTKCFVRGARIPSKEFAFKQKYNHVVSNYNRVTSLNPNLKDYELISLISFYYNTGNDNDTVPHLKKGDLSSVKYLMSKYIMKGTIYEKGLTIRRNLELAVFNREIKI